MADIIPFIHAEVCVFDIEFVPDVALGRELLDMHEEGDDAVVAEAMTEAYAVDRGIMKSLMYRIVSIAAIIRKQTAEGVTVSLFSRPLPATDETPCVCGHVKAAHESEDGSCIECRNTRDAACYSYEDTSFDEAAMVKGFLTYLGTRKPQIVGYASQTFDLASLYQRAIVLGLQVPEFCQRPAKPWDNFPDYFGKGNAYNIDLVQTVGNFGATVPKLEQIATACKIPAKIGGAGDKVAGMWFEDKRRDIVNYNECDALTTYLLWVQVCFTCGKLSADDYRDEKQRIFDLLQTVRHKAHIEAFEQEWLRLGGFVAPITTSASASASASVETPIEPAAPVSEPIETIAPSEAAPVEIDVAQSAETPEIVFGEGGEIIGHPMNKEAEPSVAPVQTTANEATSAADLITSKQLGMVRAVAREKNVNADVECLKLLQTTTDKLSKRSASDLIEHLCTIERYVDPAQQTMFDQSDQSDIAPGVNSDEKVIAIVEIDHKFFHCEYRRGDAPAEFAEVSLHVENSKLTFYDDKSFVLGSCLCVIKNVSDVPF